MSDYLLWLIIVLVVCAVVFILFPVVKNIIQNRDFKRQIEGKRPMREMEETSRTMEPEQNQALEAEQARFAAQIRRDHRKGRF